MRSKIFVFAMLAMLSCFAAVMGQPVRRQMPLPTLQFPANKPVVEVPVELENGRVVVPLSINGSRPLRYLLDTGLTGAVYYGSEGQSLNLKIAGEMQVRGLGVGGAPIMVPVASDVTFNIGGIELTGGRLAMRPSKASYDGVIGRPLFGNVVVEFDWEKRILRLYEPKTFKYSGTGVVLPLTFDEGGRPYTTAALRIDAKTIPVKLVVDTGGSHTLLLDAGSDPEIVVPEGSPKTVLGRGAGGEITGHSGRIHALQFAGQTLKDVPTIYPDASLGSAALGGRHGNLGAGILRRFKAIYDYSRNQLIVEPNKFVNEPFVVNIRPSITSQQPGRQALATELEAFLEQAAARDAFSGTVLVAKDGQPIFTKAYGMANKKDGTPNRVDTKFDLGSMNKMFTAVAIAQLVERGKLSFDDRLAKVLPDYPNKSVAEKVTIHHLLTHTSGMGNYQNEAFIANLGKIRTNADLLPFFVNDPLAFEPGTKWQYSNAGFAVLGLVIEKVSGQNYFDFVKDNIFKPAGMLNTESYERDKQTPNLAIGYMRMNDQGRPDPSAPLRENSSLRPIRGSAAGGGYSTVEDLLKFSQALSGHKLLSEKYTSIVTTGKTEVNGPDRKYAYGLGDSVIDGLHITGHNGGGPGIGANFDVFPELGYTAVVLSNYSPPMMMPVVNKIRELIKKSTATRDKTANTSSPEPALTESEQEVRKLEREWLNAYEQRDVDAMNQIVADDFKLTRSNGSVQTKSDILEQLKSPGPLMKLSTEEVQSRVDGDAVILTGRFVARSAEDGQVRLRALYTDTYVKRNGKWQVLSSQMSRVQ